MSPASAAAAVLQRPLLLHLPRPPRHIPSTCTPLRSACGALRFLQPLKLPDLPFLDWSEWRRHRGAPCLPLHQVWTRSATGTGGTRLAAKKSAREAIAVIDARPPSVEGDSGGFVGNHDQLTEKTAQTAELPQKRGRGRPKSSSLPPKHASAELLDTAAAAVLEGSLVGAGNTKDVAQLVKEEQIPVKDTQKNSSSPALKPRRGRSKKIADASPDPPVSDGVDEGSVTTAPQKRKRSTKPKVYSSTTKAAGIESIDVDEVAAELVFNPALLESAAGSESITKPLPTKSEPSTPTISPMREEGIDTGGAAVPASKIARTEVAEVSHASPASHTRGKGERVKQDERPRTPSSHAGSGISFVQILGTGMDTGDTAPSVLLFFDKKRFIFNAGEGLQRFCIEHKIKLSKIDHLFLTRVSSETANGIPGLLLTLAGIGDSKAPVDIWGTSELQYFVDAMRTFVPNASVVNTHSFGHTSSQVTSTDTLDVLYDDEYVTISATLLHPSREANGGSNSKSYTRNDSVAVDDRRGQKRQYDSTPTTSNAANECKPGDVSVVYVCELPEVKGKFNPDKAKSLGIRPGRKYSELQNGKPVPRDDNQGMVHPHEVMAPSSPGPIFVLVDCPTLEHFPSLLSKACLNDFYPKQDSCKTVSCMVHIGPVTVTSDLKYQQWMALFSQTNHILGGHGLHNLSTPILKASARVISRLNYICPQVFPNCSLDPGQQLDVGQDFTTNTETGVSPSEPKAQIVQSKFVISKADNLLKFRLRPLPALGLDCASVPDNFCFAEVREQLTADTPEVKEVRDEVQRLWLPAAEGNAKKILDVTAEVSNFYPVEEPFLLDCTPNTSANCTGAHEALYAASANQDSTAVDVSGHEIPDCLKNVHREEMEIVFLGTGSSQPSKYRNVSAIFINLFNRGGVMLDCGEGTYGQLKRRYGLEGADTIVMGLKCVWISHIHADHHTGLSRILAVRKALLEKNYKFSPILVVGPRQLRRYLDAYTKLEDLGMVFLDCSHTAEPETDMEDIVKGKMVSTYNSSTTGSERKPLQGLINSSTVDKRAEGGSGSPRRTQMQNYWLQPGYNLATRDEVGQSNLQQVLDSLGLQSLVSVPVVHCPQAFGVILQSSGRVDRTGVARAGWKLAYSGDTRPCKKLLEACEGATVLIHEATFDDGMAEEAKAKRHSMTCEAIETGRLGNVFRTILTHFSQRYPKIPVFDESYTDRTCIAFDMMSVNLADLPVLPRLLPALKLLFRDDLIVAEEAAEDGEVVEY